MATLSALHTVLCKGWQTSDKEEAIYNLVLVEHNEQCFWLQTKR
jgi:hypothetical protein